jgi:hypothetical protein
MMILFKYMGTIHGDYDSHGDSVCFLWYGI